MHSPVEQFTIKTLFAFNLFGFDIAFTNSALFMVLAVLVSVALLVQAMRPAAMVPGRLQNVAEMMFEFVADMVRSNVGEGRPPLFSIHLFCICFCSIHKYAGPYPLQLHSDKPDCCDVRYGRFHFCRRDIDWVNEARLAFLLILCAFRCPKSLDTVFDYH